MYNLVCPGTAKSGTSMLHEVFCLFDGFSGPKNVKELNYFRENTNNSYLELFDNKKNKETILTFEFSPVYLNGDRLSNLKSIADKIHRELKNPVILFTIRHPVSRSIAAYVHYLQVYSLFGRDRYKIDQRNLSDAFCLTYEQSVSVIRHIGIKLCDIIEYYIKIFGKDRILFFFLEKDAENFQEFIDYFCDKLKLPPMESPFGQKAPRVNEQKSIPQYFYSEYDEIEINNKDDFITIPPKNFYIAVQNRHELINKIDPYVAKTCLNAQEYWTNNFTNIIQEEVFYSFFEEDFYKLQYLINEIDDSSRIPDYTNFNYKEKIIQKCLPDINYLRRKTQNI